MADFPFGMFLFFFIFTFLQVSPLCRFALISSCFTRNSIYYFYYHYSLSHQNLHRFNLNLSVLSKLLTTLNESDNKLSGEQEMSFLQTLLQSKEINALVNVHHKVAKMGKDDRVAPILSASMQVI